MGKGKDTSQEANEHQSAPLSTLKDPASFGPPPKHIHYHGAAAVSATSSRTPDSGGLGAALPQEEGSAKQRLQAKREAQARAEEEANRPPPGPYRANTTGLNTDHLPKPPVFRPSQGTSSPTVGNAAASKPKLPPRLPPRQNSHPDTYAPPPPPPYSETSQDAAPSQGVLNPGALNRLGRAGVSVPGLDIGARTPSPPVPPRQTSSPSSPPPVSPAVGDRRGPQLSELQSRFARINTSPSESQPPSAGTSWADKQAALETAKNIRVDSSKVSLSDVRGAASTANNVRERHGAQAAAGWQVANDLNQKHGIANRANNTVPPTSPPPPRSPVPPSPGGIGKKPAPPPPPKKKELTSNSSGPPPIPLGSKPKF